MVFHTIWSVDLGKSALKAVKLRRDRNNVEIIAIDKIDYPISKNGVDAATQAKEALSVFRTRNEVKEAVVVAHSGQGTFSRFIKVPAFDERKVTDMVGYEASQQIPFPLDEVIWDHHIIERDYLPGEEREVALFAVRREAMDDFLLDFTSEQLNVEMVSIGYLGLVNFVVHDIQPEEPTIVLDVGATHTDLVLVDGKRFWIRPLPHSGNEITRAIRDRFKLTFDQAEKLKIEIAKVPKQRVKQIFQSVIQPKLKELLGEIHRSLVYYRSQAGETRFGKLFLLGNASKIIGLDRFLKEQLGVDVTRVQTINHFRVSRDLNVRLLQSNLPSFATTLGCGLQALGIGPCQVDLVPREEKLKKEVGRKKKHAFIGAAIVFVLLFVSHLMIQGKLSELDERLKLQNSRTVKEIKDSQREIKIWREENKIPPAEVFQEKIDALSRVAEFRSPALEGLQVLEKVLAENFQNQHGTKIEVSKKDGGPSPLEAPTVTQQIRDLKMKELPKMLWVPHVAVRTILYPPDPTGSDDRRRRKGENLVPAYEFRAYVVVQMRATNTEATDFITKHLVKPLEREIVERDLSKVPEVSLSGGGRTDRISLPSGSSRRGRGTEEVVQDGGPFYGVTATWYFVPRLPPKEDAKSDEDTSSK